MGAQLAAFAKYARQMSKGEPTFYYVGPSARRVPVTCTDPDEQAEWARLAAEAEAWLSRDPDAEGFQPNYEPTPDDVAMF